MDPQEPPGTARSTQPVWPLPHPSPPLPPPREYGAPGTPPQRGPWLLLAAVLAVALVSVGVVAVRTLDDNDGAGDGAVRQPDPTPAASTTSSEPPSAPAPAPYRCWDGSDAQKLKDCVDPSGEVGLHWIFPAMADERCGPAGKAGGHGVVLRVLCLHRLGDGTRVGVGYFQWTSVKAGRDFYAAQGLEPSKTKGPGGHPVMLRFFGVQGDQVKAANLFADEPFSYTVTFPASATPTYEDVQALAPRPADQLRGAPVG